MDLAQRSLPRRLQRIVAGLPIIFPPELIVEIMKLVSDDAPRSDDKLAKYRTLLTFRLVCRKWDKIVSGTPFLWDEIDADLPLHVLHNILPFTSRAALKLVNNLDSNRRPTPIENLVALFTRFCHFKSCKLNLVSEHWNIISTLFSQSAPMLETLRLFMGTSDHPSNFPSDALLQEGMPPPRLRSLVLHGFKLDWNSPILRGGKLTSLQLDGSEHPSFEEFTTVMKHMMGLVDLRLHNCLPTLDQVPAPKVLVSLPCLISLELMDSTQSCADFFKYTRMAPRKIHLDTDSSEDPDISSLVQPCAEILSLVVPQPFDTLHLELQEFDEHGGKFQLFLSTPEAGISTSQSRLDIVTFGARAGNRDRMLQSALTPLKYKSLLAQVTDMKFATTPDRPESLGRCLGLLDSSLPQITRMSLSADLATSLFRQPFVNIDTPDHEIDLNPEAPVLFKNLSTLGVRPDIVQTRDAKLFVQARQYLAPRSPTLACVPY
ncbi:hypothetical protein ONZ45_g6021 [Pleurotus djamor]|nr:hypothetical protein ONZ45_g6021 [Pleurotus djamor]